MELSLFIREAGINSIRNMLRREEDSVLDALNPHDIFTAQIGYRMFCRMVVRNKKIPSFSDIPPRLRLGQGSPLCGRKLPFGYELYKKIRKHVEMMIVDLAIPPIQPCDDVIFDDLEDVDLERARRVFLYAKQFDETEKKFGMAVDGLQYGSKARAVIASVNGKETRLQSLREAARFVSLRIGAEINRSKVREAIKRHIPCYGVVFSFSSEPAKQLPSGCERAVRCNTTGEEFSTIKKAAQKYGFSESRVSNAAKSGRQIDGYSFEFVGERNYAMAG